MTECTGDFGTTTTKTIKFSMTLTGLGPLIHESSRSTLRIPSQVTAQQQVRGTLRQAAGSVKLGTVLFDADAVIGQLTLRLHETVH